MPLNSRRSVVGVDLGHARIKVAMVERTATGFRVARSGIAATPPDLIRDGLVLDPEQVGDALKALLRESHIHANTGIVAAAGGSVFVRQVGYPKMAATMLRDSLKAYIELDVEAARQICGADDEVDRLQDSVYEDCISAMIANPATIQRNTYLLWTAHNLERIADRCTNICERVVYTVTGHMDELNVSRY